MIGIILEKYTSKRERHTDFYDYVDTVENRTYN